MTMDEEVRKEFTNLNKNLTNHFKIIGERFDALEKKMDHGFSLLLSPDEWPPKEFKVTS